MATETVQARVAPELKADAEALFSAMGLKTSEAIRIFLQQSVNSGGLPFRPQAKKPNKETLEAMEELANGGGIRVETTEEFYKQIGI